MTSEEIPLAVRPKKWMRVAGHLFSGRPATETVSTSAHCDASPETVWRGMLMYEEINAPPSLILRALLPVPLGTAGDKGRVGAAIRCACREGDLMKKITVVNAPNRLEYDIVKQRLGFETCVTALGGSYQITPRGSRTEIMVATKYQAFLRPRALWRPLERFVAHLFHRHIPDGMRDALPRL